VRPTLTLTLADGSGEVRSLADIEHKPWAAEEGELWVAAFPLDTDLEAASEIELAVTPDIAVALRRPDDQSARPGDQRSAAPSARAPVAKAAPAAPPPRRPARAPDSERLKAQLAAAGDALEREHERRTAADRALEQERTEARAMRAELGKLRAQLDLARAAEAEAAASAAELETARRELTAAQRQHEELTRDYEQAVDWHARAKTVMEERTGALESTREALAQQRAESGRLRQRLAQTQGQDPDPVSTTPVRRPQPPATEGAARNPPEPDTEGISDPWSTAVPDPAARVAPLPVRPQRPLNPSLRSRPYWLGRALALLFMIAVIVAVALVISSALSHH
jgi:hypothetical protein